MTFTNVIRRLQCGLRLKAPRRYLFIFGVTQRCGSTLVQRLVNSNPENLIWGENGRLFENFYRAKVSTEYFSDYSKEDRNKYIYQPRRDDLFIANLTPERAAIEGAFMESYRNMLEQLYPHNRYFLTGFKEVGHSIESIRELYKHCENSSILLLAREPLATWRSLPNSWGMTVEEFAELWCTNIQSYIDSSFDFVWYDDLKSTEFKLYLARLAKVGSHQFDATANKRIGATDATEVAKKSSKDEHILMDIIASKSMNSYLTRSGRLSRLSNP